MDTWCKAADLILVPVLPSPRDFEPTLRTMELIDASQTQAEVYVVLNFYYSYGILDRYLLEYFGQEGIAVLGKIPRTVTLSQAAASGKSVAEFAPYSSAVPILEEMTEQILVLREES